MLRPDASQEFDRVPPNAAPLVESLRAFGYELPTAIADLVDNSITARARNVWVDFYWAGEQSAVSITDDGDGLTEDSLREAMRPGSRNPRDGRDPHDLGRFGLGLKTASFSQCRRLTVRSRTTKTTPATRRWDLDHIAASKDWQLLRGATPEAERFFNRLDKLPHGTAVVWQQMDRLVSGQRTESDRDESLFLQRVEETQRHLGVVFHRLLTGRGAFKIRVNGRMTEPWDPFLADEPATHRLAEETLGGGKVLVRGYVLPHLSKLTAAKHASAAGPRGWNAHQGFYIYRNRRLLVAGDWLGFGWTKEEHYKLARIAVDLPNSLDQEWELDVTKSKASPPPALRHDLRRIGEAARAVAKRIYSFRGAKLMPREGEERIFLWHQTAKHNRVSYAINRDHPLVHQSLASSTDKPRFNALLRLIEETVPAPLITITNSEKPDQMVGPFEKATSTEVRGVIEQAFEALRATGYSPKEAIVRLRTMEPFPRFPAELVALVEAKGISA
jgi:hypothetical protein